MLKSIEIIKCLSEEEDGSKEANQAKLASKSLAEIKEIIFFSDYLWVEIDHCWKYWYDLQPFHQTFYWFLF